VASTFLAVRAAASAAAAEMDNHNPAASREDRVRGAVKAISHKARLVLEASPVVKARVALADRIYLETSSYPRRAEAGVSSRTRG
jgi:hypothetical protein